MATTETSGDVVKSSGGAKLTSLIYDPKVRGLVFQIGLILALLIFFIWIITNTVANLSQAEKRTGFEFLGETAGFQILTTPGTWVLEFSRATTYGEVFLIGVVNTLAVSVLGIIAATLLGFVIGIFRLSSNAMLRGFGTVYVEVLRNIPLLVQLLVWYKVVVELLPDRRAEPVDLLGGIGLSGVALVDVSGMYMPYPIPETGFNLTLAAAAVAVIAWIVISVWAKRRQETTGKPFPTFWTGLGLLIFLPLIVFLFSGAPLDWEEPVRGRFGFRNGVGMVMKPEMFAVFLGLTLYTAAFIAEIVRAGILAVNKGQTEAANALGLRAQPTLSLVVIPQALRVIIPPLTSQYLNLVKNSSLAVAIGYPEVVSVFLNTARNQIGQEIEPVFMAMTLYLFFSVTISVLMNWYNRRMALVER